MDKLPANAKARDNQPYLMAGLEIYIKAFNELRTERQVGMAEGSIPWSKIVQWGEFNGVQNIERLLKYIWALEIKQQELQNRKASSASKRR